MKYVTIFLFSLCSFCLNSQLEVSNLDVVTIDENMTRQQVSLDLLNNSDERIDFDWEVIKLNDSEAFLEISVSDINNDYLPHIKTTCDLQNVTNVLEAQNSYTTGLHFTISEIPDAFDKNAILGYFNLYRSGQCYIDTLISLPIYFEQSTQTVNTLDSQSLTVFPNPTSDFLNVDLVASSFNKHFQIYDAQGKLVMKQQLTSSRINLSKLASGTYLFKLNRESTLFIKD